VDFTFPSVLSEFALYFLVPAMDLPDIFHGFLFQILMCIWQSVQRNISVIYPWTNCWSNSQFMCRWHWVWWEQTSDLKLWTIVDGDWLYKEVPSCVFILLFFISSVEQIISWTEHDFTVKVEICIKESKTIYKW